MFLELGVRGEVINGEKIASIYRFISKISDFISGKSSGESMMLDRAELICLLERLQDRYVLDAHPPGRWVRIGAQVALKDILDSSELNLEVTLPDNSDPSCGKISVLSPLGAALFGRQEGDIFIISLGNRLNKFRIMSIDRQS